MKAMRWLYACIALLLLLGTIPTVSAQDVIDSQVQQVITQLEAIDTLQQIQDNRNSYKATTGHYDVTTTRTDVIADHEGKRADYETYVNGMFAARLAAKQAYDALSDSQKQLIDPALVAKLDDTLSTRFNAGTFSVTPSDDEYCFEASPVCRNGDLQDYLRRRPGSGAGSGLRRRDSRSDPQRRESGYPDRTALSLRCGG